MNLPDKLHDDHYLISLLEQYNNSLAENGDKHYKTSAVKSLIEEHLETFSEVSTTKALLDKRKRLERIVQIYGGEQAKKELNSVNVELSDCSTVYSIESLSKHFELNRIN